MSLQYVRDLRRELKKSFLCRLQRVSSDELTSFGSFIIGENFRWSGAHDTFYRFFSAHLFQYNIYEKIKDNNPTLNKRPRQRQRQRKKLTKEFLVLSLQREFLFNFLFFSFSVTVTLCVFVKMSHVGVIGTTWLVLRTSNEIDWHVQWFYQWLCRGHHLFYSIDRYRWVSPRWENDILWQMDQKKESIFATQHAVPRYR